MLHLEAEIKNSDLSKYSDDELFFWMERQINDIQQREFLFTGIEMYSQARFLMCLLD